MRVYACTSHPSDPSGVGTMEAIMVRSRVTLGALAAGLTVLGGSGCLVREQPVTYASAGYVSEPEYSAEVYVQTPPPAPVAEYPPPPPAYGYVWINGYWDWSGYDWYWA